MLEYGRFGGGTSIVDLNRVKMIYAIIVVVVIVIVVAVFFLQQRSKVQPDIITTQSVDEFYDNGNKRRTYTVKKVTSQKDGSIVSESVGGPEQFFYPSGALNRENSWVDGQLNGAFTVYYEDGNIYIQGSYKKGKFAGTYKVLDKNNRVIWSKQY